MTMLCLKREIKLSLWANSQDDRGKNRYDGARKKYKCPYFVKKSLGLILHFTCIL